MRKQQELMQEIEFLLKDKENNMSIPKEYKDQINKVVSDESIRQGCKDMLDLDFINNLNFEQLEDLYDKLCLATRKLGNLVEDIDIYFFLKDGYRLDLEKLQDVFNKKGLIKQYPNINLKVLTDYYEHPPKYVKPYWARSNKDKIYINPVLARKFIIAILQMVFNEMDLVLGYTGGEGTGKSTLATQHMLFLHKLLKGSNIVDYEYKINDMMFSSLQGLRNAEDDHFSEKFRQFTLDEGNELHRQNWKEEEVQTFFQRLRRERFNQRIKSICIPVLGELMTNIIMTRINFVFEVYSENKNKIGLLDKGKGNFYIIPRGTRIYSYEQKKELTRDFIKTKLHDNLQNKTYLKGLPKDIIIKKFTFNGVSGFRKEEYNRELKEANKSFNVKEGIKLTNQQIYILNRLGLKPKKLGLTRDAKEYATVHKLLQYIRNYYIDNSKSMKIEEEKFLLKYPELNKKLNGE